MRRTNQMSEVEIAQHRSFTEILNNSLSTPEEKKTARLKLDALEWKGLTGPVMELIAKLTLRLDNVEELGQSMTEDDRKAVIDLRQIAKRLSTDKLNTLETNVSKTLDGLAELTLIESQHHEDNQSGWSKHEGILVDARVKRQAIGDRVEKFEQRANEKFREVEKKIDDFRRGLGLLVADAIAEAKDSIMAEAELTATTVVGKLLGESDKG